MEIWRHTLNKNTGKMKKKILVKSEKFVTPKRRE